MAAGGPRIARAAAVVEEESNRALHAGLLPLDATEEAMFRAADEAAREVFRTCDVLKSAELIVAHVEAMCSRMAINPPRGESEREVIARATDRAWWLRSIRKAHARRFEHAAIKLGFTGLRAGPYLSDESVTRQRARNKANEKLLDNTELQNEFGQVYTLAELAGTGMANKSNRRGELMTRIRGFEEIAQDLGHIGMFWTQTCPSKFHAVGGENERYEGASPREAQGYLVGVWAKTRAKLHRMGIRPYGFRIAEPHTDGCPHWHMLLFVELEHVERVEAVVRSYALAEDGDEPGAQKNRVKLVRIEAGKGTAAGYIAKYVAKNIDGHGVNEHKTRDNYTITTDVLGDEEITPSERVTYWSQVHGIRQFQQIGGAPVGVWRELRRVKAETVQHAPEELRQAWQAVQSIKANDLATGEQKTVKQADWAQYLRAQGGPSVGRCGAIQLAKRSVTVTGRYAVYQDEKPVGVYAVRQCDDEGQPRAVYESVRYRWERVKGDGGGRAVGVPWTGVNNCTPPGENAPWVNQKPAPDELKNKIFAAEEWAIAEDYSETPLRPDPGALETYQRHRKKDEGEHLRYLKAKYEH
jgi:hypothetical protein